jgi:type I restriction enzyme, S subunit
MIADLKPYPVLKDSGVPWLREVPEHWEVKRIKTLFREKDQRCGNGRGLLLSLTRARGILPQTEASNRIASAEDLSKYKVCRPGDLVMNRMQAWSGMFAVSPLDGVVSPDYSVFEPIGTSQVQYFEHLFKTPLLVDQFAQRSKGIGSGFNRLYTPDFGSTPIVVPPQPEQSAIVRFLDHYDKKIRRYIRAKQKLIKLLEEQKQAIIHRAVTRGLDPNVRLKPSGVEWLGDVPEHWKVENLGQIAVSFRTGPFGSILHQADYVEDGVPLVNPKHMNQGLIVDDKRCTVTAAVAGRLSNYLLEKHDLIFSRRGELGRCALVRDREAGWLCGTGSIRVRVAYNGIDPEYLIEALQVRWVGEYLSLFSVGATMDSLNTGILKGVPVLLPPIDEQREILRHIVREVHRIFQATSNAGREISLLHEYRTRLIADVVTGKLDVREAAACLPDEFEESEPLDEADTLTDSDEDEADDLDGAPEEAEA